MDYHRALFANSQFAEAAEIHRKTLASSLEALGWEHADTLASANNLAMALRAEGKASEAELLYTEAMEVMKRVFGPESWLQFRATSALLHKILLWFSVKSSSLKTRPMFGTGGSVATNL